MFHLMFDSPPTGLAISLAGFLLFWVIGLLCSQFFTVREKTHSLYVVLHITLSIWLIFQFRWRMIVPHMRPLKVMKETVMYPLRVLAVLAQYQNSTISCIYK